ncbi:hypothetical protein [Corynebacterium parakroppenstedtii]|uniref:hypothetical protein n=1 Tax=Corynebacterium parakroppenstedtii TaxID=2828363 RepID=UPI0030EF8DD8
MDYNTANQDRYEEVRRAIEEWKDRVRNTSPYLTVPSDEDINEYLSIEDPESKVSWTNKTLQAWKLPLDNVVKATSLGIWSSLKESLDSSKHSLYSGYLEPDERFLPTQENDAPSREITDRGVDYSESTVSKETSGTEESHQLPVDGSRNGGRHMATAEEGVTVSLTSRDVESVAATTDYGEEEFDELDLFEEVREIPGGGLRLTQLDNGQIHLQWPLPETDGVPHGAVTLYRVVSEEEEIDLDPAEGELRTVTGKDSWVDSDPMTTAIRVYQIWMNVGETEASALHSQPYLVGHAVYVQPIDSIDLTFDGSSIRGQWELVKRTDSVQIQLAMADERNLKRRRNRICEGQPNLQGFRWKPEARGLAYQVMARRIAEVNGRKLHSSWSKVYTVDVGAELSNIDVIVHEAAGEENVFEASWKAPSSGQVRIYRSKTPHADGIEDRDVEVKQLEGFGLSEKDWENDLNSDENSCRIEWPDDGYDLFITPVSVVGDKARVGRTQSRVRVGVPTYASIHEHVTSQLITFGWPEKAHEVAAFIVKPGEADKFDPKSFTNQASLFVDEEDYKNSGGMRTQLGGSIDVVLVASRVYEGKRIWGRPVVLHYVGITAYSYKILANQNEQLGIAIEKSSPDFESRTFTLRYRSDRLPLEPGDGREVKLKLADGNEHGEYVPNAKMPQDQGVDSSRVWVIEPKAYESGHGFLRLFWREPSGFSGSPVALRDPDPRTLRIDYWEQMFINSSDEGMDQ